MNHPTTVANSARAHALFRRIRIRQTYTESNISAIRRVSLFFSPYFFFSFNVLDALLSRNSLAAPKRAVSARRDKITVGTRWRVQTQLHIAAICIRGCYIRSRRVPGYYH